MERTKKEQSQARYNVACTSEDYTITGNVTIEYDCVTAIENGEVKKNDEYVASFGQYGNNLNINYVMPTTAEQQTAIVKLIDDFKTQSVNQ